MDLVFTCGKMYIYYINTWLRRRHPLYNSFPPLPALLLPLLTPIPVFHMNSFPPLPLPPPVFSSLPRQWNFIFFFLPRHRVAQHSPSLLTPYPAFIFFLLHHFYPLTTPLPPFISSPLNALVSPSLHHHLLSPRTSIPHYLPLSPPPLLQLRIIFLLLPQYLISTFCQNKTRSLFSPFFILILTPIHEATGRAFPK